MNFEFEVEKPKYNIDNLLDNLNKEQLEAVTSDINKNIICNSIAGSGKTQVLTRRVGYLISKGVSEDKILLLTFTNKAAAEMTERVQDMLDLSFLNIKSGTFHSIAAKYLRKYAYAINYDKNFTILDQKDSKVLINDIREEVLLEHNLPKKNFIKGRDILNIYSDMINLQLSIDEIKYLKSDNVDIVGIILDRYDLQKKSSNLMDFDDLLVNFNLILENREILEDIRNEISYILVDEYQDINYLQDNIIKQISNKEKVFVVGDPSQSIYGFRGSDIKYINNFKTDYDAVEINLKRNYRSDKNILKLAERCINNNKQSNYISMIPYKDTNYQQHLKEYRSSSTEIDGIVSTIKDLINDGVEKDSISILLRGQNAPLYKLESTLRSENIDYELRVGISYFEKEHIKDILSILTLIINNKSQLDFTRVFTLLPGVGKKTCDKIFIFFKNNNYSFEKSIKNIKDLEVNEKIREEVLKIFNMYIELKNIYNVKDKIQFINNIFYKNHLYNKYFGDDSYESRYNDILSFAYIDEDSSDLSAFLENIVLDSEIIEDKEDIENNKKVIISTMHRAKGLEWDYVFIPFLNNGIFPRDLNKTLEEERRLFYVSLTRARKKLFLSYSKFDEYDGRILEPSIFIHEII